MINKIIFSNNWEFLLKKLNPHEPWLMTNGGACVRVSIFILLISVLGDSENNFKTSNKAKLAKCGAETELKITV